MKKLLFILCALMLSVNLAEARPHGGSAHAPRHHISAPIKHHHHHHHDNAAIGFVAGLIGGSILNYALNTPSTGTYTTTTSYSPMVVSSPIVSVPAVGSSAANIITTTTAQPCYTSSNLVTGTSVSSCSGAVIAAPVITQTYAY